MTLQSNANAPAVCRTHHIPIVKVQNSSGIGKNDIALLKIVKYPDPILSMLVTPVAVTEFDTELKQLPHFLQN
jgi:hypothetical protein